MTNLYKIVGTKTLYTILASVLFCGIAQANTIQITNEDSEDVKVTIEGEDGKLFGSDKDAMVFTLKPNETRSVKVTEEKVHQKTFNVIGTVKLPSIHNKCGSLLLSKDYEIYFVGGKLGGVVCVVK